MPGRIISTWTSWSACGDARTDGMTTSRGMWRLRPGFPNWRPPNTDKDQGLDRFVLNGDHVEVYVFQRAADPSG